MPGTVSLASGSLGADLLVLPRKFVELNAVGIGSIATVWTPASGKRFRLLGMSVSVSVAGSVLFEDNAAGAFVFRTPALLAATPYTVWFPGGGYLSLAANNVLKATGPTAATLTGTLFGTEE